jgi:hypothetical protein
VSGELWSELQEPLVGIPGLVLAAKGPFWVNTGTGLDVDEFSWKGLFDMEAFTLNSGSSLGHKGGRVR